LSIPRKELLNVTRSENKEQEIPNFTSIRVWNGLFSFHPALQRKWPQLFTVTGLNPALISIKCAS